MLIGITGVIGAGKTYTAKTIKDYCSDLFDGGEVYGSVYKFSISEPIKNMVKMMFGWTDEHTRGKLKEVVDEKFGFSPRRAMQVIGKNLLELKDTLWDDIMFNHIEECMVNYTGKNGLVLVDDVRFPHDFESIKSRNGIMIGVIPDKKSIVDVSDDVKNFSTEQYVDELLGKCDYVLYNTYDVRYGEKVRMLCDELMKGLME